MKKIPAFVLCVLLLMGVFVPAAAAFGGTGTVIPTVYVVGKGNNIVRYNAEGEKEFLYRDDRVPVPENYIADQVKALLPQLARAVITNRYDDYCDALVNTIKTD